LQDTPSGEVTLKCTKEQEALCYPDVDGHFEAPEEASRVSASRPIHIIWGERETLVYVFHFLSKILLNR
jgi:hypothetical protein